MGRGRTTCIPCASQNHLYWKIPLRSSPAIKTTLPSPPLNHVPMRDRHLYILLNTSGDGNSTTSLSQCLTAYLRSNKELMNTKLVHTHKARGGEPRGQRGSPGSRAEPASLWYRPTSQDIARYPELQKGAAASLPRSRDTRFLWKLHKLSVCRENPNSFWLLLSWASGPNLAAIKYIFEYRMQQAVLLILASIRL